MVIPGWSGGRLDRPRLHVCIRRQCQGAVTRLESAYMSTRKSVDTFSNMLPRLRRRGSVGLGAAIALAGCGSTASRKVGTPSGEGAKVAHVGDSSAGPLITPAQPPVTTEAATANLSSVDVANVCDFGMSTRANENETALDAIDDYGNGHLEQAFAMAKSDLTKGVFNEAIKVGTFYTITVTRPDGST